MIARTFRKLRLWHRLISNLATKAGSVVRALKVVVYVYVCRGPNFPKGCVSDGDVIVDSRCTYPIIYANFRVRVARFKGTPFSEILWVISPWESFGKYAFKRFLLLFIHSSCSSCCSYSFESVAMNFFLPRMGKIGVKYVGTQVQLENERDICKCRA